jgi:hypothetical protein
MRSLLFGSLASTLVLGAEPPEYSLVAYYYTGLKEVDMRALRLSAQDLELEFEETILGFELDINGDGVPEHMLRGNCGNGGCALWVIDGDTNNKIATLSGRFLLVHSARINGWPVISTYHKYGATDGTLSTYVYEEKRYQQVSSVHLYDQSVSDLVKKLESVPSIGNPPATP